MRTTLLDGQMKQMSSCDANEDVLGNVYNAIGEARNMLSEINMNEVSGRAILPN